MSFEVLTDLTAAALSDKEHQSVQFIWHGGEPTLLGARFYERAMFLQSQFRRSGQIIHNQMQTNATRLSPQWIDFLIENGFDVGISLDGPQAIHDRQRRYLDGSGSFHDIMTSIDLLRGRGITPHVLMVIDHEAMDLGPEAIFEFFCDQGIPAFGLVSATPRNEVAAGTQPEHHVRASAFNVFLGHIYRLWLSRNDPQIRIREIDGILSRMHGRDRICRMTGDCFGRYFLIEPDGRVAHCDLFVGDSTYDLGSVLGQSDFARIRASDALRDLSAAHESDRALMRDCAGFSICQGWCPHERYLARKHAIEYTPTCCGQFDFIDEIRQNPPPAHMLPRSHNDSLFSLRPPKRPTLAPA